MFRLLVVVMVLLQMKVREREIDANQEADGG